MAVTSGPRPAPAHASPARAGEFASFGEVRPNRTVPRWVFLIAMIAAQGILAVAMQGLPRLALGHFAVVALVGLYAAVKRDLVLSMCVLAYLPAAEVMWRQVEAPVPYMAGPYLAIMVAVLALIRGLGTLTRPGRTALLYLGLLLPSAIVTYANATETARQALSFGLAGPVALVTLVMVTSQVQMSRWLFRRVLWIALISGIGPLAIAFTSISSYIATNGSLDFSGESNYVTAGNFGPVQVSSIMGFSVVVGVLLLLVETEGIPRIIAGVVAVDAAVQSLLTFSRGGMTATGIAIGAMVITMAKDRESRRRAILIVTGALLLGYFVLIPRIDAFTQGAFSERFSDAETGRTDLASNDIAVFRDHMVFGVGPGMTKYQRLGYDVCALRYDRCEKEGSSHTEFTRMLSEHGLPGLLGIVVLASLAWSGVRRAGPSLPFTVTFLTWSVAQMVYANMRIVAIPIAFGFAFLHVVPEEDPDPPDPRSPSTRVREEAQAGDIGAPGGSRSRW